MMIFVCYKISLDPMKEMQLVIVDLIVHHALRNECQVKYIYSRTYENMFQLNTLFALKYFNYNTDRVIVLSFNWPRHFVSTSVIMLI